MLIMHRHRHRERERTAQVFLSRPTLVPVRPERSAITPL